MTAKPNKNLLRISPLFANRERGLAPLLTGNEPIASIPQLQTLQGSAATLAAFREQAAHCQLLQLSTHAGADENDFAPRIEFIDQPLYLPELYAMKIPAELVVLSACETGLGRFEKGEGVMSLARGFAYAGANDLVASLWKVNESSTSELMQYFYANIKTGQTKSAALREAKLQYLREAKSDTKLTPYYWAGFVSIGHDLPMDLNHECIPWWALLTIAAFIFVFIFWKYKTQ
jgi:CHAT domain-containing protein